MNVGGVLALNNPPHLGAADARLAGHRHVVDPLRLARPPKVWKYEGEWEKGLGFWWVKSWVIF